MEWPLLSTMGFTAPTMDSGRVRGYFQLEVTGGTKNLPLPTDFCSTSQRVGATASPVLLPMRITRRSCQQRVERVLIRMAITSRIRGWSKRLDGTGGTQERGRYGPRRGKLCSACLTSFWSGCFSSILTNMFLFSTFPPVNYPDFFKSARGSATSTRPAPGLTTTVKTHGATSGGT